MALGDLTTLQNYKDWANVTVNTSDNLLKRLISSASSFVVNWLNKPILFQTYSQKLNGNGNVKMVLSNWPVNSVTSLVISGITIPASPDGLLPGYVYDSHAVYLVGNAYLFNKGLQNVSITYTAGYKQTDSLSVPSSGPYTLGQTNLSRPWGNDVGVVYHSSGIALAKVPGAPGVGQYAVDLFGTYTFASGDAGAAVDITYGAAPYDVEQATIELIASRYKERDRIGIASKSVANENVTFSQKDMSEAVKTALQNYKNVVPL